MAPPKKQPGWAEEGELTCKHQKCGKPVPAGELTWIARNSHQGWFLVLCIEHRQEVRDDFDKWLPAANESTAARLVSSLTELKSGTLVSDTYLRELLEKHERPPQGSRGALSKEDRKSAKLIAEATEDLDTRLEQRRKGKREPAES